MQSKKLLTILCCGIAACAVLCAVGLMVLFLRNGQDRKEYEDLQNDTILIVDTQETPFTVTPEPTFDSNEPSPTPTQSEASDYEPQYSGERLSVDFNTLKRTNSDVIAWLYLPDTVINYPVVAADKDKNESYYLTHSFNGRSSGAGTLYIEQRTDIDFQDRNTVINGHRRNDETMFGSLYKYENQSFYESHPIFQLYTPDEELLLYVIASFESEAGGFFTKASFANDSAFMEHVNKCKALSDIDASVDVEEDDRLVTLVTCVVGRDTLRRVVVCVQKPMP